MNKMNLNPLDINDPGFGYFFQEFSASVRGILNAPIQSDFSNLRFPARQIIASTAPFPETHGVIEIPHYAWDVQSLDPFHNHIGIRTISHQIAETVDFKDFPLLKIVQYRFQRFDIAMDVR
jgi:hypothetical protein